jgi:Glycine-zipper domain
MTARRHLALPLAVGLLAAACATVPTGPGVMVLPGQGKSFEAFQVDDMICRQFAAQQTGTTTERVSGQNSVGTAAIGTVLGAGLGAAVGAAAGDPGIGAAVGAGTGLLGGTAVGVSRADAAITTVQGRYDASYMQCMYAKGNQIPVARGWAPAYQSQPMSPSPPPPPAAPPSTIPPPPAGTPPPPPPKS